MGIEIKRQKLPDGSFLFVLFNYSLTASFTESEFEHLCRICLKELSDCFNEKRDMSKIVKGDKNE